MYIYDVEVFGGNFFSACFKNLKTGEEIICFKLDGREYNIDKLYSLIKEGFLIGYNCSRYDDIMLNCIWKEGNVDTWLLYQLSNEIIHNNKGNIPLWKNPMLKPYTWGEIQSLDLMRVLAFDKMKVSLKQCSVNLRYPLIQDLVRPPETPVREEEVDDIIKYNLNDVYITEALYNHIKGLLNLRYGISKEYNVDVLNASKTYIGKTILNKYYEEYTGIPYEDFKDLRTERYMLELKDCLSPKIHFKTSTFNDALSYFKNGSVILNNKTGKPPSIDYLVLYNGKGYQMGFGGLHSVDSPAVFRETDTHFIIDADVSNLAS